MTHNSQFHCANAHQMYTTAFIEVNMEEAFSLYSQQMKMEVDEKTGKSLIKCDLYL